MEKLGNILKLQDPLPEKKKPRYSSESKISSPPGWVGGLLEFFETR